MADDVHMVIIHGIHAAQNDQLDLRNFPLYLLMTDSRGKTSIVSVQNEKIEKKSAKGKSSL